MIQRYDETGHFSCLRLQLTGGPNTESLGPEPLGSKRKTWVLLREEAQPWLFKFARQGSGEHWAEKLGSECAGLLGLPAARVELAMIDDDHGALVESIIPYKWDPDLERPVKLGELIHGNEVLAGYIEPYDRTKQRGQTEHTLANIVNAVKFAVPGNRYEHVMMMFAGLLVLDALIGNTDRHHENWALLRMSETHGDIGLAPSYDHASSLGRELQEDRRRDLLASGLSEYIRKGRGAIFGQSTARHADNPQELVRWAAGLHPRWFRPWLDRVGTITREQIEDVLERMPKAVMNQTAKDFCGAFLCYTRGVLEGM